MSRGERWTYAIVLIVILGMFGLELAIDYTPAKLSGLFFFLAWAPLLALHEAGHALVARLFGCYVDRVVVGFGRSMWVGTIAGIEVDIRLAPIEGFTHYMGPVGRLSRVKSALIAFAGPGIELLLATALLVAVGPERFFEKSTHAGVIAAQSVALAAVVGALVNLIPMESKRDNLPHERGIANDGRAIIDSLLGRR